MPVYTPYVSATLNGSPIDGVRKGRVVSSFSDPVSRLYLSVYPAITVAENDTITITMGSGTNNVLSGTGTIYEYDYTNSGPTFEIIARGPLFRAKRYKNNVANGLTLDDLTGGPATDEAIAKAVLDVVGITYNPLDIGGTGLTRGDLAPAAYTWRQGESAFDYLTRLSKASLGYRMVETIGGDVERIQVLGRPRSTSSFSFEQGVDIFGGARTAFDASARTSAITVTGYDYGDGAGPVTFTRPDPVPAGVEPYVYSSEMIERAFEGDPGGGISAANVGITLVLPEVDRVLLRLGGFRTPRDDLFQPGQTHQVNASYLGLTNELLQCMSVTRECDQQWFTQTLEYLGGGAVTDGYVPPEGLITIDRLALPVPRRRRLRDYTMIVPSTVTADLVNQDFAPLRKQELTLPPRGYPRSRDYSHIWAAQVKLIGRDAMIAGDQSTALPPPRRNPPIQPMSDRAHGEIFGVGEPP